MSPSLPRCLGLRFHLYVTVAKRQCASTAKDIRHQTLSCVPYLIATIGGASFVEKRLAPVIRATVAEIGNWMDLHGRKVGEVAQVFKVMITMKVDLMKMAGCGVVVERVSGCNHMTVRDSSFSPSRRD